MKKQLQPLVTFQITTSFTLSPLVMLASSLCWPVAQTWIHLLASSFLERKAHAVTSVTKRSAGQLDCQHQAS